jgi:hypothetical protein
LGYINRWRGEIAVTQALVYQREKIRNRTLKVQSLKSISSNNKNESVIFKQIENHILFHTFLYMIDGSEKPKIQLEFANESTRYKDYRCSLPIILTIFSRIYPPKSQSIMANMKVANMTVFVFSLHYSS